MRQAARRDTNETRRLTGGTIMDLVALADFDAVARHGGFAAASRATGRPKASLSRRVMALEAELGVRLIERGGRTPRLTQEGADLHRRTGHLLGEIGDIGDEIKESGDAPHGRLRISVPGLFASTRLGGIAAAYVRAHPRVTLDVVVEDRFVDPATEGVDLVVRASPATDSALVGHLLQRDTFVVAARPDLVMPTAAGAPVPAVRLSSETEAVWRIEVDGRLVDLAPRDVMRASSMLTVRDAVRAGAGAAILPRGLAAENAAAGRLRIWGRVPDKAVEVWVLYPSRRLTAAKVKAFVATLRAAFDEQKG